MVMVVEQVHPIRTRNNRPIEQVLCVDRRRRSVAVVIRYGERPGQNCQSDLLDYEEIIAHVAGTDLVSGPTWLEVMTQAAVSVIDADGTLVQG